MSKHVVFVVGEGEYESERTMPALAQELAQKHGFKTTVLLDNHIKKDAWTPKAGERLSDIPGLDALKNADLAVFYLRFRTLPENQLALIDAYVKSGRPVAGFRTSTHSFNYAADDKLAAWNKFGAEVLGAPWIKHYGHDSSSEIAVIPSQHAHPVLAGVPAEFHVRSWLYQVRPEYPPADATWLLEGTSVGPSDVELAKRDKNPVAWVRKTKAGGRVFFTTLGHPEDFTLPAVRTVALNGLAWAAGTL